MTEPTGWQVSPMTDPLDKLTEWREITDKATEGPWSFQYWGGQNQNGDYSESILFDGHGETLVYGLPDSDGELAATARTAMPALLTAVGNVLKLHQPRTMRCIYGDCAAETCDHEDIEDCPTRGFQQCVECDRLADEVGTYYPETQVPHLTAWPCPTVTAIRDAIGGAE